MTGPMRIADALLRSLGGRTVLLHIPAPAVAGDIGEQIGLGIPEFQDLELRSAALRKVRAKIATFETEHAAEYELLVSASALDKIVASLAYDSAEVLFEQACGVIVDGELREITSVTSAEAFGSIYVYRVGLRGPAANLV